MTSPKEILDWFEPEYIKKFEAGQKEHGGNLTDMGLRQSHANAKQEVQDLVSYLYTMEKAIDEIEAVLKKSKTVRSIHEMAAVRLMQIEEIIQRVKND